MRIDIKRVKGKEYIQLVEGRNVFHVGAAADFDSWIVAMILWEKHFREEYKKKKEEALDEIKEKIKDRVRLNDIDLDTLIENEKRDQYNFNSPQESLKIPRLEIYGDIVILDNEFFYQRWTLNERGKKLRKRLNEIKFKERRLKEKEI